MRLGAELFSPTKCWAGQFVCDNQILYKHCKFYFSHIFAQQLLHVHVGGKSGALPSADIV